MSDARSHQRVTLLTPCHARDLDRFLLQRESIERCRIELSHVVVVDHEDLSSFRDLPFMRGVMLVSTRDVLSRSIEARRRSYRLRRRQPEWWRCRLYGRPVHGWGIQQVIKLAAPRVVTSDAYICIDTDTFFVGRVTCADFIARDGRPFLYETVDDLDAEMGSWPASSMKLLGISATGKTLYRYTHSPVVMNREVVVDLHRYIEHKYNRSWDQAFLESGSMEYTTYGVYARDIDLLRRVHPHVPALSTYFWWPDQVSRIQETFVTRVRQHTSRIVGVQSNVECPVLELRSLAEEYWAAHSPEE